MDVKFSFGEGSLFGFDSWEGVTQGIGDACKHSGIRNFIKELSKWSGSPGYCLEIGNGSWDSWTKPLLKQTSIACEKVVNLFGKEDE
ncbi:hypothetical protein glysoja_001062 [Glycine soja]|nr:hypothetical protein glysoja_001062 [Glycine soja]